MREHMKVLMPSQDLTHHAVSADSEEVRNWNPQLGPCCIATVTDFKILLGRPRHPWNVSASRVFTDSFLTTHSASYEDTWEVRRMVLEKCLAHIKSLIRTHSKQIWSNDVLIQRRLAHRRRQRKGAVSYLRPITSNSS